MANELSVEVWSDVVCPWCWPAYDGRTGASHLNLTDPATVANDLGAGCDF